MKKSYKSKMGFTLSEVLITLGIIGIVAMLTIPAVVKNYRNKLYAAQLKRTYGMIEDAVQSIMADEHATSFSETTAGVPSAEPDGDFPEGKGAYYFLNKYFKTIKTGCNATENDTNQCRASAYASPGGEVSDLILYGDYCAQTTNGATICSIYNEGNNNTTIMIDVNGPADPNIAGRDAFTFNILSDGSMADWSSDGDDCGTKTHEAGHIADYASGCITKIIEDGWEMKY